MDNSKHTNTKNTMNKIKKTTTIEEKPTDTKLDLIKYTSQVQSDINTNITSDFVLAKLNEQDKTAIIEMTDNAYHAKKILLQIAKNYKQNTWNPTTKQWEITPITKEHPIYKKIQKIANKTFNMYMIKMQMIALLNRNVEKNHLINILAQRQEEDIPKEQLLQPLIKDETIKQIMTTDENFNKLKHRLTHNITAYNKQGEIILTTQKYNETIQETIQKTNKDLLNKQSDSAGLQLNQKGYKNTKILENQRITRIQITTTFKKA